MKKALKTIEETEEAIKIIQIMESSFILRLFWGLIRIRKAFLTIPLEFLARNKLPAMALHVLTPYPGTRLYQRFKDQGESSLTIGAITTTIPLYFNPRI